MQYNASNLASYSSCIGETIKCHPTNTESSFLLSQPSFLRHCSTNMDFPFGDFCLSCDRQTNGTSFCSSACRLTQLDHFTMAPESTSSSSSYSDTRSITTVSQRPTLAVSTRIYLPPAYDFSIHRTPSSNSLHMSLAPRPHSPKLSEQAQNDLKDYVGSFDQTRTLRRRVSMQSNDDIKSSSKS